MSSSFYERITLNTCRLETIEMPVFTKQAPRGQTAASLMQVLSSWRSCPPRIVPSRPGQSALDKAPRPATDRPVRSFLSMRQRFPGSLPPEIAEFTEEVRQAFEELGRALGSRLLTQHYSPPLDIYER